MAWQLVFTDQYTRRAARFLRQHPSAASQYAKTLQLRITEREIVPINVGGHEAVY